MLRVEQVDLLGLDESDTLHADDAEQVDAQSADNSRGHGVDQRHQFAEEAKHDGHDSRGHQHGGGVVAGDRHERVVLAIVRTGTPAEHANNDIVRAVGDEVEADEFFDVVGLASQLCCEFVNVEAHLVKMRGAFRHSGDEDERDT